LPIAVRYSRRVWLHYVDAAGAESEREFDPYGLVFHYGRWYLVGLDQRSREDRAFRVDRILAVEERDATFERPAGFDAVGHLERMLAGGPWGIEVEVLLETTLDEARAHLPGRTANLEAVGGGVLLRTRVDDLRLAARYIVGMGWPFRVVSPSELRDEVFVLGQELLDRAS
jgi:predicted DNA-binding transcriptional regulator YafY